MIKYIAASAFSLAIAFSSYSQQGSVYTPASPMKIPLFLAGNFGELRNNHFHSGLDFKTQGKIGIPIYAFDEGYVSRVMISPSGNGRAVYLNHPNGLTTVYIHLDRFSSSLDAFVEDLQYKEESFVIDHTFKENEMPVKKGELIAYSGNSGSSGGPHLHFEVRDTKTEEVFDPMFYFRHVIRDKQAPKAQAVMIYPMLYDGVINGVMQKRQFPVAGKTLQQSPLVWGKIALGLKAFDYKDQVSNIYGVKNINLYVDGELVFSSRINRFSFKDKRYINSFIDYNEWRLNRSLIMRSFVEPGNQLSVYETVKDAGIINIDQERDYKIRYVLTDDYNNSSEVNFVLRGKKQEIPLVKLDCHEKFFWNKVDKFKDHNIRFEAPAGTFYDDFCFKYEVKQDFRYYAEVHTLHQPDVPFHGFAELEIKLTNDTLRDKTKYYLARVSGKSVAYQGGGYKKGWIKGLIREFGNYTVAADQDPPAILRLKSNSSNELQFRISDRETGIKSYRATIDGHFALFEYDPRKAMIVCKLSSGRVKKGQEHTLKLIVTDNCDNVTTYESQFTW